jgi:cytokinesis protein
MDTLLEKLRAAAPQHKDTRDRRRRARLQNRHQVRVASGQKIPDPDEIPEIEESLKSPESVGTEGILSPITTSTKEGDEDDVADRAALLLQGMRGTDGADDEDTERRDSIRRARRRDNAEEERKARRRRRDKASSVSETPGGEDTIIEESGAIKEEEDGVDGKEKITTPTTVVVPPSPEGTKSKPIELDDD